MIPLEEAQAYVLGRVGPLEAADVELRAARRLVTAETVTSAEQIPPFANTAVDGYAVLAADTDGATSDAPAVLDVVDTLPAGAAPSTPVAAGQAIRIMTGAPLPPGADAVAMVEWTESLDDGDRVAIDRPTDQGNAVRGAGEDLQPGDIVFDPGVELTAGHLGVLASIGRYRVRVTRRPRVGVFSTGDELIEGSEPLEPGQIRDANRHSLVALCDRDGFEAVDLGIIPDDEAAIEAALVGAAATCDALLTSGGVSMGDYDYVKAVLDRIGEMRWMQVAIKPAKPLAFGTIGDTPVFGLPGNPVSSMVSYELFARPGLRKMMGHADPHRALLVGRAGAPLGRRPDGKTHFARVTVEVDADGFVLASAGGQGSHQLTAMAGADGLAMLVDGDGAAEGDTVPFLLLRS